MEQRIKFHIDIPSDILGIKDVFKQNGHKLFLVGGCVRDALLNIKPKDFDLATDALPDKVESMLNKAGYKTLPTGKVFGVINVFTDQGEYEVATMRSDGNYTDGRRPDSVIFGNIESDSLRRDLSINALYYDLDTQEIIDLVGGVNDIKNGVVRTVGKPEDRFKEDRLRILRICRFSGRFGSELDISADGALQKDASLEGISGERIRDEFLKGITSAKSVKHFLNLLDKYKLFDWIFKGLNVNKDFLESKDTMLVIAHLLKENNPPSLGKRLIDLKYTVDEAKGVVFLLNLLKLNPETAVSLKKAQKNSGVSDEQIRTFGTQEGINTKLLDSFIKFKLSINGEDVMSKFNLKPGKELGDTIHRMELQNFQQSL